MRLMPLFLVILLPCLAGAAQQKTVTLYLDCAKVEVEETARQGYLEFAIPAAALPGSLRVTPLGGSVQRVEVVPRGAAGLSPRERGRVEARRCELHDRLKALSVREEVFTAAARSQSGKSLRKSKNNPDPLGALRQGTEYALGQLEGIYRARRRCEGELREIERELSRGGQEGEVARVWLSGRKARLSYLTASQKWSPCYAFRAAGTGRGEIVLHGRLPPAEPGVRYLVAQGALAAAPAAREAAGEYPVISRCQLPLDAEVYAEQPYPALSISFKGGEPWWPPGEAAGFWHGAYVGSGRFPGGGGAALVFGK